MHKCYTLHFISCCMYQSEKHITKCVMLQIDWGEILRPTPTQNRSHRRHSSITHLSGATHHCQMLMTSPASQWLLFHQLRSTGSACHRLKDHSVDYDKVSPLTPHPAMWIMTPDHKVVENTPEQSDETHCTDCNTVTCIYRGMKNAKAENICQKQWH